MKKEAVILRITYLGHAGFCVETDKSIVIMDPWLSPVGAFDSAWFQFPCNHHLAAFVQEKLLHPTKAKFIYLSHEHKDHFDPLFLQSLPTSDFVFVVPKFRRTAMVKRLEAIPSSGIVALADATSFSLPDGKLTLYLDDAEMDRDSGILVEAEGTRFLNINDCKIHDRLHEIQSTNGSIDVFAAQFSGAVWHPTCYDYPRKQYEAISMRKVISKFEAVARAIETLRPRLYFPSAGPACFLDPLLFHLNFERRNIFPRANKCIEYLTKRLKTKMPIVPDAMPGDVLDTETMVFTDFAEYRVTEDNFVSYIRAYGARYKSYFDARQASYTAVDASAVYSKLEATLLQKLNQLTLRARVKIPLYFVLSDGGERALRVDFQTGDVSMVTAIHEVEKYVITSPSWEVARIFEGRLTWEDFTLTFRMRLNRDPDVYHVVIHGFLTMEPEDMNRFCERVLAAESNQERTLVEVGGRRFSIHRFCPHQGADLSQGWIEQDRYLVCPRHHWRYDLHHDGKCTQNDTCIHAFPIEDE